MVFLPSPEVRDRLHFELAGAFIDRSLNAPNLWVVAKLPTNLIREIRAGAEVSLVVWIVDVDGHMIPGFGLRVYDDAEAPFTCFGSCRSAGEAADLCAILARGSAGIQFHNENRLPLLSADSRFEIEKVGAAIENATSTYLDGDQGVRLRERADDIIEELLAGDSSSDITVSFELPLTLETVQALTVHVVGIGDISLDDPDQGNELERLTLQALDSLFPFGVFHSPQIGEGKKRRELCDVLAVSRIREIENEGIFVIQNKVAAAFSDGLKRKTWRRAKSIQNNILEGISQLEGAIKALQGGAPVYRADGTPIDVDPHALAGTVDPLDLRSRASQIGEGIVVVSDMHDRVDWEAVFLALGRVFLSTGYYCHVLDLKELARLITHSKGRPAILEGLLLERAKRMLESKNAFIRFHFVGGEK